MKIKTKITVFTCALCMLSVFLVSQVNYYFTAKKLLNETEENARNIARITAREMDKWLSIQKNSLKEMAEALLYNGEYEFDYVHNYLGQQGEINKGNVYYLGFPDGSAIFGIDYTLPEDFDCTEREWYIKAQSTDEVVVTPPYIDFRTGDMTITLSKAIKEGNSLIGVLGSDILINDLIKIVSNLELSQDSYGFLLDGNGDIIVHENEEFRPDAEKGYVNVAEILDGKLKDIVEANEDKNIVNDLKDYDGLERSFFIEDMNEADWKIGVAISTEEIQSPFRNAINTTIIITVIIIIVTTAISFIIGNSISKPIERSVKLAAKIGELDLSQDVSEKNLKRKDEIGQMAVAFQSIIDHLKDFSARVSQSSEQVAASSQELTSISQEAASASNSIAESAGQIAMDSENQQRDILNVVSAMEEISAQIEEISANAEGINNLSQNVSTSSDEGRNKIEEVLSQMRSVVESADRVHSTLIDVDNSSKEMDSIIQVIQEVAEQTNLLALNAAIEAARAGEYGKGFAVVAEEIRKLAEKVQDSTEDIYGIIRNNQDIIDEANKNMDISKVELDKGLATIDETKDAFMAIIDSIAEISEQIESISQAIAQVAIGTEDVVGSVSSIEHVSREIWESIQNVSAATEEQAAAMEEITSASESLAMLAEELQLLISRIKM